MQLPFRALSAGGTTFQKAFSRADAVRESDVQLLVRWSPHCLFNYSCNYSSSSSNNHDNYFYYYYNSSCGGQGSKHSVAVDWFPPVWLVLMPAVVLSFSYHGSLASSRANCTAAVRAHVLFHRRKQTSRGSGRTGPHCRTRFVLCVTSASVGARVLLALPNMRVRMCQVQTQAS